MRTVGVRLNHEHPGFSPRNLLAVGINLPATRFPRKGQADAFLDELRRRAGSNPGVLAATISESIPPHLGFHVGAIETVDRGVVTGSDVIVSQAHVDDGFFLTLDIPLIQGRTFDERDRADGLRVAVIGRATGRRLWPEASAVGRQFRLSPEDPWLTVVGVVGDVKNGGFDRPLGELAVYYPRSQALQTWHFQSLVVRTRGEPAILANTMRELVRRLDPSVPVFEVATADELIAQSNARVRFATMLMAAYAAIALLLALVGVYGAFWCAVRQRARELGVRVALGAEPRAILGLVLATSARLAIVGLTVGLALALAATRTLKSLLFEVSPTDPATLTGVGGGLLLAALAATYVPARRASRANPVDALRQG